MIPNGSNYPNKIDTDDNLFLVHDSLRVRLFDDYNPGDKSITIEDINDQMQNFPDTGIITLTEQCSDIDKRAISLYYGSKTSTTFDELELLPEFEDVAKFKIITNVTMNVLNKHHNHLKDALINYDYTVDPPKPVGGIQYFAGIQGSVAKNYDPANYSLTERINFLKSLAYSPKAWFSTNKTLGIVPLSVTFKSESEKTQNVGDVTYVWTFGDGSSSVSVLNNNTVSHTYTEPGVYDVELTVTNKYGTDSVLFKKLIKARIEAPEEAIILFNAKYNQIYTQGTPAEGPYDYETPPKIRSPINTIIELEIPTGVRNVLETPNQYTHAGELLNNDEVIIDPIVEYTWNLSDELIHDDLHFTRASYSIGGYYDVILRVDTAYGAYRITKYQNSIDIVEMQNLWLFNYNTRNDNDGGLIETYEFGLLCETFKTQGNRQTRIINRNNSFLDIYNNLQDYDKNTYKNAKKEFNKNVLFATFGTNSGDQGNCLLFYASGGAITDNNLIKIENYNAFADSYSSLDDIPNKAWNWVGFSYDDYVDFILGKSDISEYNSNLADNVRITYNIQNSTSISKLLSSSDFENGADELLQHPSNFSNGVPTNGYFSTYRSTWKDQSGYILRNSAVNEFFRISNFYRTNGVCDSPYTTLTKMPNMSNVIKIEGELVALSNGVFFFDNSGEVSAWNDVSLTWEVGRSSSSSLAFRSLQDTKVVGFADKSNTLLAVSDNDRLAYLSYDYSNNAFIKYNGADQTFTSLGPRYSAPGNIYGQFKLGIY